MREEDGWEKENTLGVGEMRVVTDVTRKADRIKFMVPGCGALDPTPV